MWDNERGKNQCTLTIESGEMSALSQIDYRKGADKMAERVCCLYRVSTAKQVDHDEQDHVDIPMQRKVCHEFVEKMGWMIVGEEQETGVSGYKVSADDRDKLQLIKKKAEQGKFDILLVFMFDRDAETY